MLEWGSGANCVCSCKCHTGTPAFEGKAEILSCVLCQRGVNKNHRHLIVSYPNIFSLASWAGCLMWLCCLSSALHSNIIWTCWLVLATVERIVRGVKYIVSVCFVETGGQVKELCISFFHTKAAAFEYIVLPQGLQARGHGKRQGILLRKKYQADLRPCKTQGNPIVRKKKKKPAGNWAVSLLLVKDYSFSMWLLLTVIIRGLTVVCFGCAKSVTESYLPSHHPFWLSAGAGLSSSRQPVLTHSAVGTMGAVWSKRTVLLWSGVFCLSFRTRLSDGRAF